MRRFEELLHDVITSLESNPAGTLADVEFVIADIPDLNNLDPARGEGIPLARNEALVSSIGPVKTRITVYRHPITVRCAEGSELAALLLDVVIEQLADIWGVEPDEIDDRYGESE